MPPLNASQIPLRIGVDVGGTFTDLVASDGTTLHVVKIPSTPPDFHRAVIEAVRLAIRLRSPQAGAFGAPTDIIHGSTVATNALLQRAGAPVAFVTTDGFRDMLLIGRQNRQNLYALNPSRPEPLTASENWFTVRERIGANGGVVEPLTDMEVNRLLAEIQARGLHHVAVCLLFSFINPAHEKLIARKCEQAGLILSLSSDVLPEFREYERASTTVINAGLRPVVSEYLEALMSGLIGNDRNAVGGLTPSPGTPGEGGGEGFLRHAGKSPHPNPLPEYREREPESPPRQTISLEPSLRILHSSGGTLTPPDAARNAARLVLSGPAGGVIGAAFVAQQAGFADVITYDMGGTSTDVAVILNGQPQWTTSSTIDGLPIGLPMFDIHTVGAGGGSMAALDAGGALRVGPKSAGAIPGPACYNRGGTEPTVTDANLLLGRILPDHFLGGAMRIEPRLARDAIAKLAAAIGKTGIETALGIVKVAEANMEHAIRNVTSRRGHDPRQFTLVSFGGAGGLHACALAESLEIPRVLIPPYCGVLSALGMVVAPAVADASRTVVHLGDLLDDHRLISELGSLNGLTDDVLPYEETERVEPYADVRFRGQSHELTVRLDRPSMEHVAERFLQAYRAMYGSVPQGRPIEVVTLRIRRYGHKPKLQLPALDRTRATLESTTEFVGNDGIAKQARVVSRGNLPVSTEIPGPLLLIDPEATTLVPAGWAATAAENGSVVLRDGDPV